MRSKPEGRRVVMWGVLMLVGAATARSAPIKDIAGRDAGQPIPALQPFAGTTHALDDPAGEYSVDALDGDTAIQLTGRVGRLRIASLNGAALLDASHLAAKEIVVAGPVNGGSALKLNAPGGSVVFAGTIGGGTKLEVNAPDGSVSIGGEARVCIDGGTHIHITTRKLLVSGTAAGGARVSVDFSSGGTFQYALLDGGAAIRYRTTPGAEIPLKIEPGLIRAGASLREGADDAIAFPEPHVGREQPDRPAVARPPVPPADAFSINGPSLAAGIVPIAGPIIPARIVSIDDDAATYQTDGSPPKTLPLSEIAVILFRPFPESKRDAIARGGPGLLLRSGDFVEGTATQSDPRRIRINSVIFGFQWFDVDRDVIALVLHKPSPEPLKAVPAQE